MAIHPISETEGLLVSHKVVRQLPPPPHTSAMMEYLFAGNGVFLRAHRPALSATIPVQLYPTAVRGLPHLIPELKLDPGPIPKPILLAMWRSSLLARTDAGLLEILFYLQSASTGWRLHAPPQIQGRLSCQATQPSPGIIAEFHSHGSGQAGFSATDNAEEDGFRSTAFSVGLIPHVRKLPYGWEYSVTFLTFPPGKSSTCRSSSSTPPGAISLRHGFAYALLTATTPSIMIQSPLNPDFLNAQPLLLPIYSQVSLVLVGCGGTGSWLAPALCRLARTLSESGKLAEVTFIDPDCVEAVNVLRQNFCDAEVGFNKAQSLALRYSLSWGLEIGAIPKPFDPEMIALRYDTLTVLVGCVDNAAARQALSQCLPVSDSDCWSDASRLFWLDCGNHAAAGQVLLGTHRSVRLENYRFHELGCLRLPAPSLLHPELLVPQPEELDSPSLACEELAQRNVQSLGINQRVAAEAAGYLFELLFGQCRRFATYFDLPSGSAQSRYLTEAAVRKILCVL